MEESCLQIGRPVGRLTTCEVSWPGVTDPSPAHPHSCIPVFLYFGFPLAAGESMPA